MGGTKTFSYPIIMKEKIIGIDLGTTNSVVSIMEGGKPIVLNNSEGHRTTPSVVFFSPKSKERQVGELAKRKAIKDPKTTITSIKSLMGKPFADVKKIIAKRPYKVEQGEKDLPLICIQEHRYNPQEISAIILQKLKETAEEYLEKPPKKAVITVPAYFNDAQRQATKDAGEIAGLEVVRIINEPTAAALAYGIDKKEKESTLVVYDLGGGTFDVTCLHMGEGVFEVKSTHGDTQLGGDDFDDAIIDFILEKFKKQEDIDLRQDPTALQRIKEEAEKAKKELSNTSSTEINIPFITATSKGPLHLHFTLTQSELERLCKELIDRTIHLCQEALHKAHLEKSDIDKILLVGGSTRMPAVQKRVAEFFGKEPSKSINPDEAVAMGAAIQGGIIAGDVKDVVLLDVTPLSLGIETIGALMTKLIDANTTIPTKKSRIFSTAQDHQPSVDIHVLQGERPMAKDNRSIGRFVLSGIPSAPRGVPQIEVSFDIDVNGIVSVSAKDKGTGKEQHIRIEASSSLSKEEIEKMKQQAAEHAEQDQKEKEKVDKLNKADSLIFQVNNQLKDDKIKMSPQKRDQLTREVADLKKAYEAKNIEEIEKHSDTVEKTLHATFLEAMQHERSQKTPPQQSKPGEAPTQEPKVEDAEFEEVK